MRMLESHAYDDKENHIAKEKLSTTEEEVNKILIELSDMYESSNRIEGVERIKDKWRNLMKNILIPTVFTSV